MRLPMLKRRSEFITVKSGASWGTPGFLLQARLRDDLSETNEATANKKVNFSEPLKPSARFGVTVTKQTVRRFFLQSLTPEKSAQSTAKTKQTDARRGPISVLRNKMRRRLKEALYKVAPDFARPGVDYVLIGRGACLSLDFEILIKDLEKSFQKVHRRIIPTGTEQTK